MLVRWVVGEGGVREVGGRRWEGSRGAGRVRDWKEGGRLGSWSRRRHWIRSLPSAEHRLGYGRMDAGTLCARCSVVYVCKCTNTCTIVSQLNRSCCSSNVTIS